MLIVRVWDDDGEFRTSSSELGLAEPVPKWNKGQVSIYFQSDKTKTLLGFPVSERSGTQTLIWPETGSLPLTDSFQDC